MVTNDVERILIDAQMRADTVWCFACGLQRRATLAVTRYGVVVDQSPNFAATLRTPACRACLLQALRDGIAITDLEPVVQPLYVGLLTRLLT